MGNEDNCIAPIDDPRPFADVLSAWQAHNGYSNYRVAKLLSVTQRAVALWLDGKPCPAERSHRALMTLIDEGRA